MFMSCTCGWRYIGGGMDLFSRGVCGAGVRVSSDDDGGCCRTVCGRGF